MMLYFILLGVVGFAFLFVSNKMADPNFKPNELSGVRTPETLADEEIWHKVNVRAALYFKHSGFGFFALAFMSLVFARGILALFIFIGIVVLVSVLLWRNGQLKEYAKQLYAEKYPDSLESKQTEEKTSEDKE